MQYNQLNNVTSPLRNAWDEHLEMHRGIRDSFKGVETDFGYEYLAAVETISLGGLLAYGGATAIVEGGTAGLIPGAGWIIIGGEIIWIGIDIFQGLNSQ